MARIMISWGLISVAMMFVRGRTSFYALRFLLGAAEAGFFPGMILYLTYWIPQSQRARAIAWFMTSTALSGVIAGSLAGVLLGIRGLGLHGWQWLFLVEGVPSIVLGVSILFLLTNRPQDAHWLPEPQRKWLEDRMRADRAAADERERDGHKVSRAFKDPTVWIFSLVYGALMFGFYGINYWAASVVAAAAPKASSGAVGFLSAIPFLAAAVGMVLTARVADRTNSRRAMLAIGALTGAIGMALTAGAHSPAAVVASLSLAAVGIWSALGPFWALPGESLTGAAAAAGIALINSFGNLGGGMIGSNVMGAMKEHFQTYAPGLLVNAAVLLIPTIVISLLELRRRAGADDLRRSNS
jgi:sugar phosphate permease